MEYSKTHTQEIQEDTNTHPQTLPLSHLCCNILSQSLLQWDTTWHVYSTVCHSAALHQGRGSDLSFLSPKASLYVTTQGDIMVATGGRSLFICTLHPCSQPQCSTEPALCVCEKQRDRNKECVCVCVSLSLYESYSNCSKARRTSTPPFQNISCVSDISQPLRAPFFLPMKGVVGQQRSWPTLWWLWLFIKPLDYSRPNEYEWMWSYNSILCKWKA